jgi:hypothetical protein
MPYALGNEGRLIEKSTIIKIAWYTLLIKGYTEKLYELPYNLALA